MVKVYGQGPTFTVPVINIRTENNQEILDKENYIEGYLSLEIPSGNEWENFGESIHEKKIGIRGRGNFTWFKTEKKSYKIKFDKKLEILGMPMNKHFAIISYDPFYPSMWLGPIIGLELARLIDPGWVPKIVPVEVILNDDYKGIYLFVETIRVEPTRLNIYAQENNNENTDLIPYGWLVELDNQNDDSQIVVPSKNIRNEIKVTYKTPEVLSSSQKEWLINEFETLTALIESPECNKNDKWENHFDLESLARYIIIREILHDVDGYSGSQYFYKDIDSEKWSAGPFWDMELWPEIKKDWIVNDGAWSILNWIPFMMNSEELRRVFIEQWNNFYENCFQDIFPILDQLLIYVTADKQNAIVWPEESESLESKLQYAKLLLTNNGIWIDNNKNWSIYNSGMGALKIINEPYIYITDNILHIKGQSYLVERIRILDITGKLLQEFNTFPSHYLNYDFSNYNKGIYIIGLKYLNHNNYKYIKVVY